MKQKLLVVLACTALLGLDASAKRRMPPKVGADKDAHGCIASAGYTWSELEGKCVRTFELTKDNKNAIELLNADKSQKMTVLFSSNKSKAEIFSDKGHNVVVKNKKGEYIVPNKENPKEINKLVAVKKHWKFVKIANKKQEVIYE